MEESDKLPISCYIRTKNEEQRIGEVVKAACQLCDEVIVIDSESQDRTCEISASLGAKVIHQPWLGEGYQKRLCEERSEYDWLLDLDADEVLSSALAESISALFKDGKRPPEKTVYALKVATVDPTGCLWEFGAADYRNKLYNRRHYRCPTSKVWSNLDVPKYATIVRLQGHLEHHSFPNIEFLMAKVNRASTMRAMQKSLKPLPVVLFRIWFYFPFYLFRNLIRRGMWRYGVYSWVSAVVVAFSRWLTDVKMYEIHRGVLTKPKS